MTNAQKFVKNLELGIYRRPRTSLNERFGHIEDYSLIKEKTELRNYIYFINSRRGEELEEIKVKSYMGDNF